MKNHTKRSSVVRSGWALTSTAKTLQDTGHFRAAQLEALLTAAHTIGLAAIECKDELGGFTSRYGEELQDGRYYFVPQDAWNWACELDNRIIGEWFHRREVLMKYGTEKTYDLMKAAGF